jgi:hypothetical protein
MNTWKTYTVTFWDQDPQINDCFGNSRKVVTKARSPEEARSKAKAQAESKYFFRLRNIIPS